MQKLMVKGVHVVIEGFEERMSNDEINAYIELASKKCRGPLKSIGITKGKENNVEIIFRDSYPVKFERIRRITGYLVGKTDRWNNAKKSEEKDRVKHI